MAKIGRMNGCLIEGMGCPGGCVAGAGTNIPVPKAQKKVQEFVKASSKQMCIRDRYENMFRHFAWKYPGKVSANIYYSEAMSHKIYASCDAFLMPSLFEPCGLSQLMSLRYGTVPIVRETGGLKDTVEPYNEYEKLSLIHI